MGFFNLLFVSILCLTVVQVYSRRVIRATLGTNTTGSYIVVLTPDTNHTRFETIVDKVKNESVDHNITEKVEGPFAKIIAAKISEEAAHRLKYQENVEFIEEETYATKSVSWALDRIDQTVSNLDNKYTPDGTGKGVDIYILDTGISYRHNEFGSRAKYPGFDPVDKKDGTNRRGLDCEGHGTHVASLAAGSTFGVATGADVYSVRVLDCDGGAPWSVVIDGLSRTANRITSQNPRRSAVISFSLGGSFSNAVDVILRNVLNRGIPIVAAAGNERDDACNYSPSGTNGVITVGGSSKGDGVYYYTNGGNCVDVFAPGSAVTAADYNCNTCKVTWSGTSMATPIVSGAVAILLEKNSSLSPSAIRNKLIQDSAKNKLNYNNLHKNYRSTTANRLLHVKPKAETVTVTATSTNQVTVTQTVTSIRTTSVTTTSHVTTTSSTTTTVTTIVPTTLTTTSISVTTSSVTSTSLVTSTVTTQVPTTVMVTSTPTPTTVTVTETYVPSPTPEEVCCSTLRNFEVLEDTMMTNMASIIQNGIQSITQLLTPTSTNPLGRTPMTAAESCKEIAKKVPTANSGLYYVKYSNNGMKQIYCELKKEIKGNKGFTRIANINMKNNDTNCPQGLSLRQDNGLRTCQRHQENRGCSSVTFNSSGVEYTRVCGRIRGYQWASPNAFFYTYQVPTPAITDTYLDGVVLAYRNGTSLHHIWSFAAAIDDSPSRKSPFACQCTNKNVQLNFRVPSFVGDDYFCETGSRGQFEYDTLYTDDPLWDGQGCSEVDTCCERGEWFCKDVPKTNSNIELRLCGNEDRTNEDTPLELIELYVQ